MTSSGRRALKFREGMKKGTNRAMTDVLLRTQFVVLAPLRLLGARYMPRLRKTLDAEERFWVTTGLGNTWTATRSVKSATLEAAHSSTRGGVSGGGP